MILLTDNGELQADPPLTETQWEALSPILNKPLGELLNEHEEGLLVFPHSFPEGGNEKAKRQCVLSGWQQEGSYKLAAGNLAGFISYNGEQITILSRFSGAREQANTPESASLQDHFLHYLLQKVFSVNITTQPYTSGREQLFDLLPYFFPMLLNRALQQGLYREYRHMQYNDARVRGRIDVARHLRQNMPFMGRIAYSTREFSHNNTVTQLVRHTIEHLRRCQEPLLSANPTCCENVAAIIAATPDYSPNARGQLLRRKPRYHPYYTEYGPLQTLCRSILRHETVSYGHQEKKVNGILFDVAWLWEEYLATLLTKKLGFAHPNNSERKGGIYLTRNPHDFIHYPDFYRPTVTGPSRDDIEADIVADAKYKFNLSGKSKSDREEGISSDVKQMITYLFRLKARRGVYLMPSKHAQEPETWELLGHGKGGSLECLRLHIPQADSSTTFPDFCKAMEAQEAQFMKLLTAES